MEIKTAEEISELKVWFFGKIKKIDKFLGWWKKEKSNINYWNAEWKKEHHKWLQKFRL